MRFGVCDPEFAFTAITSASNQKVVVGNFRPVIENANQKRPFKYELDFESEVPLNVFLIGKAILSLGSLQAKTDHGLFINDWKEERKAMMNSFKVTYDPIVKVGDEISPGSDSFGVTYASSEPPFQLKVMSSKRIKQIIRTYISIPELIGNIGGAIEAVIMIVLLLFHWLENISIESKIIAAVSKSLKLPAYMRPSMSTGVALYEKCCKKRNKDLAFKAQSSEVVGEIVDKALSIEQMSYNQIMLDFFLENSFPDEIRQLVPVVHVMKEIVSASEVDTKPHNSTEEAELKPPVISASVEMDVLELNPMNRYDEDVRQDKFDGGAASLQDNVGGLENLPRTPSDLEIPDEGVNLSFRSPNSSAPTPNALVAPIAVAPSTTQVEETYLDSEDQANVCLLQRAYKHLVSRQKERDGFHRYRQKMLKTIQNFARLRDIHRLDELFVDPTLSSKKSGCWVRTKAPPKKSASTISVL